MKILSPLFGFVFLCGCAVDPFSRETNWIEFNAQPDGAVIINGSTNQIVCQSTPCRLHFEVVEHQKQDRAFYPLNSFIARWPSGAQAYTPQRFGVQLYSNSPKNWNYTFLRPAGADGLNEDISNARGVQQQNQKNSEAGTQLMLQGLKMMQGGTDQTPPQPQYQQGTHTYIINGKSVVCTTNGTVTNCY